MNSFADTLAAINAMKTEGVIDEYAVAGAMAQMFWAEPIATLDLDVLVFLPPTAGALVSLEPIYAWAARHGYATAAEHIVVESVPTRFLPSPKALSDEAIRSAATLDYGGVPVRVVRPEHLLALCLEPAAKTARRRERAAALLELPKLDRELVDDILKRHGLTL
jgi:hypothetical protein